MIKKLNIFLICVNLLNVFVSPIEQLDKIRVKNKWFIDKNDRTILFRGINAVQKNFPWVPNERHIDMTNVTQLNNLKKWGFNSVRLGIMWSGLMPEKDQINQTYLNEMIQIVNNLALNGIYTIIDLHQDVLSSKFGTYDGAPLWLLNEMPKSKFEFPWPLKNSTINLSVFAGYITESCGFSFQCLYKNVNNFGFYFEQYWATIAKAFANNTAILGYELINEPWAGDIYSDPLLLLPKFAGSLNLLPFYDKVHATIRNYDKETLIFYEPVTWGVTLNENYFKTGFNRAPGNDSNGTVFSWHYYCWLLALDNNPLKNDTYPFFDRTVCDKLQINSAYDCVKIEKNTVNSASFLTEFGVCAFPEKSDPNILNTEECEGVLNANDKYMESWTYWDSNFYYDNGSVNYQLIDIFSRVYPMSTNGIPQLLDYNTHTKKFSFIFETQVENIKQTDLKTIVFVPYDRIYPNGFNVSVSSNLKWSFEKENKFLLIEFNDSTKKLLKNRIGKNLNSKIYSQVFIDPNN